MARDFGFEPSERDFYFASYNSRDEWGFETTKQICKCLNDKGIRIWYDKGLLVGNKWMTSICEHIERCRYVIMFISSALVYNPEGDKDSGVLMEYDVATKQKKKTIIPVLLDEIEDERVHNDFGVFYNTLTKRQGVNVAGYSPEQAADAIILKLKALDASVTTLKAGDTYQFGRYPQWHGDTPEPIEWMVLEVKDGRALLLSKCGLDAKWYNEKETDITWENCTLRKWLNSDFFNTAFTAEEQKRIQLMTLQNADNPKYGTPGGNPTKDKVALLSIAQARKYFDRDFARVMENTAYAESHGVTNGTGWWWLRSPGNFSYIAAIVGSDGSIAGNGCLVDDYETSVRPALWLNL